KLVLFFDEAHLLFSSAPKILLEKVEQVVRLIRSKGVGVYFVTQNPSDIPEDIQGQLGNRIQHALRAFTPSEQKKVRAAAQSLRANPVFDTETVLGELAVGEALVSTLDEQGVPTVVERVKVRLPESRLGPLQPLERQQIMMASPLAGKYDTPVDAVSAFETLGGKQAAPPAAKDTPAPAPSDLPPPTGRPDPSAPRGRRQPESMAQIMTKSLIRAASSQIGRQVSSRIVRGILGAIIKGGR
ncbi:MAG TPA: DUF853 family protein, partial [Alphaproteobacteria bacterium]|nr:DUF853 family protein [Alphaproteobacteria bacterium]